MTATVFSVVFTACERYWAASPGSIGVLIVTLFLHTPIMTKVRVTFFHRKPYASGNYSLEFLFSNIRERLKSNIDCRVFESTFHSRGLWKRVFNIIESMFGQSDVNLITGDIHYIAILMRRSRTVLVILDCGFLHASRGIVGFFEKLFWLTLPVRRVKYIVTISEFVKNEIVCNSRCNPNDVFVIPVCISDKFCHVPRPFNSNKPRLLQVGQTENKNLTRIIEALVGLNIKLVVVGNITQQNLMLLDCHAIDYTELINISAEEMVAQYVDCDALLFPSTYEGFGMPILEAQAVGRPVITSNVASMPWVAGDGACLVDPFSVDAIRDGIERVISDEIYRNSLVTKGLANVRRFDPDLVAAMYLNVINRVSSGEH